MMRAGWGEESESKSVEGAARRMRGASRRVEIDGAREKEVAGEVCAAGLRVGG